MSLIIIGAVYVLSHVREYEKAYACIREIVKDCGTEGLDERESVLEHMGEQLVYKCNKDLKDFY